MTAGCNIMNPDCLQYMRPFLCKNSQKVKAKVKVKASPIYDSVRWEVSAREDTCPEPS